MKAPDRIRIRRNPRTQVITVTERHDEGTVAAVHWESSSLREALRTILDNYEPGYALDVKVRV